MQWGLAARSCDVKISNSAAMVPPSYFTGNLFPILLPINYLIDIVSCTLFVFKKHIQFFLTLRAQLFEFHFVFGLVDQVVSLTRIMLQRKQHFKYRGYFCFFNIGLCIRMGQFVKTNLFPFSIGIPFLSRRITTGV